jgi:hypothetical protein
MQRCCHIISIVVAMAQGKHMLSVCVCVCVHRFNVLVTLSPYRAVEFRDSAYIWL